MLTTHRREETLLYVAIWTILFAAPVISAYVLTLTGGQESVNWGEVAHVWLVFAGFFAVFLVHNFILSPLLVYKGKTKTYLASLIILIAIFQLAQCMRKPEERKPGIEMRERPSDVPPMPEGTRPPMPHERGDGPGHRPPVFFGQHDIVSLIVVILMIGMNLGVKYFFRYEDNKQEMKELERRGLERQLEYLKYQINPHFFMNTLNNIFALVDIDAEKAKTSILELSKLMRFVLYEADKQRVPLDRELSFISTYIALMRLRYTDRVSIEADIPTQTGDKTVPPLLLISFVENAFKHGVSYRHDTFISVKVEIDADKLTFLCRNSKTDNPKAKPGGVGLKNTRQRLDLLYGNRYSLEIADEEATYGVKLVIPLA